MKRKYEPSYDVTLTLRLSTRVDFARISEKEDDDEITKSDAIENAIGGLDYGHDDLERFFADQGYALALPIDGEAVLVGEYRIEEECTKHGLYECGNQPGCPCNCHNG